MVRVWVELWMVRCRAEGHVLNARVQEGATTLHAQSPTYEVE